MVIALISPIIALMLEGTARKRGKVKVNSKSIRRETIATSAILIVAVFSLLIAVSCEVCCIFRWLLRLSVLCCLSVGVCAVSSSFLFQGGS